MAPNTTKASTAVSTDKGNAAKEDKSKAAKNSAEETKTEQLKDNPAASVDELATERKLDNDANKSEDEAVKATEKPVEKKSKSKDKDREAARMRDTGSLKSDGLMKRV